jgi:hypothetical protein
LFLFHVALIKYIKLHCNKKRDIRHVAMLRYI